MHGQEGEQRQGYWRQVHRCCEWQTASATVELVKQQKATATAEAAATTTITVRILEPVLVLVFEKEAGRTAAILG